MGTHQGFGRIVVAGQGYVGLPMAMRLVQCGHDVVGFDVDRYRIGGLSMGMSFAEDVSDATMNEALASGRYRATTDPDACRDFDVAIITVPTPLLEGAPDVSYIRSAAATLARYLRPHAAVILESTTYPGTTDEIVRPILEEGSGLVAERDFFLGYSPERIDPGVNEHAFWHTAKLVSGVGDASLRRIQAFYSTVIDEVVPVSRPEIAELAKLMENTFRHVNIALVNEIAMFAGDLGIDVWEAIDAAATKPFGYMKFVPGPGVGGHCLPIDPSYLSWRTMRKLGVPFRFVELANAVNDQMPEYITRRITYALNTRRMAVNGSRILLLGLAYKANTADARESPSLAVAELLLTHGARVRACDPLVGELRIDDQVPRVALTPEELRAADLVVILTDHDVFDYDTVAAESVAIFDARNRVHSPQAERL